MAIKIESFIDVDEFKHEVDALIDWVKSSPTMPGVESVLIPGEIEERNKQARMESGIDVEQATWDTIVSAGASVGVDVPAS